MLASLAAILSGCGGGAPVPPESSTSTAAVADAKAVWTPDKVDTMKDALSRRKEEEPAAGPITGGATGLK